MTAPGDAAASTDRPNVLLIMTDQQRGDCLGTEYGFGGRHPVVTPNLDRLAIDGARFLACYSTVPVCIPARRSLLAGQSPRRHGMVGYADRQPWHPEHTLPSVLSDAGYHTQLVGRGMHQYPFRKRFGYDEMVISPDDYDRWLTARVGVDTQQSPWFASGVKHNDLTVHPWPYAEDLHPTNWTVHQARRFLQRRDPSQPYFLTVSFLAPHPPLQPPAFYLDRYRARDLPEPVIGDWATANGRWLTNARPTAADRFPLDRDGVIQRDWQAAYYASINHVDDQIRRLLDQRDGVDLRNTIVVFTSDHGDMLGDHGYYAKRVPYQGSARVPLIITAPERSGITPGAAIDVPTCLEDVMPTVLDLLDIQIPDSVDGHSLAPVLRGERQDLDREHVHLEFVGIFQALTDGREKYVWSPSDGREQLFDLVDDPDERHDLSGDEAAADRLRHWRGRLVAELRDRPEGFVRDGALVPGTPPMGLLG